MVLITQNQVLAYGLIQCEQNHIITKMHYYKNNNRTFKLCK